MTLPAKRLKYIETLTYAKFKPNYIDSDGVAIQGNYKNVTLVSNEKKEFNINHLILASLSPVCCSILLENADDAGRYYIKTELTNLDLYKICTFATRGDILGYENLEDLLKDKATVSLFKTFGVDLSRLNLSYLGGPKSLFKQCRIEGTKHDSSPMFNQSPSDQDNKNKNGSIIKREKDQGPAVQEEQQKIIIKTADLDYKVEEDLDCFDNDQALTQYIEAIYCEPKEDTKGDKSVPASKKAKTSPTSDEEWIPEDVGGGDISEDDEEELRRRSARKRKVSAKVLRTIENDEGDPDDSVGALRGCSTKKKDKKKCKTDNELEHPKKKQIRGFFWFPQDETLKDKTRPFQCHLCVRGYFRKNHLDQHIMRHSARCEQDLYFCTRCDGYNPFSNSKELKKHDLEEHHDELHKCPHCSKTYKGPGAQFNFERHIEKMHTIRQCAGCGLKLMNFQGMQSHLERMGPFHDSKCRICPDFEAKTWNENVEHMDKYHNGEKQYKCGFCPAFFKHIVHKNRHIPNCPSSEGSQGLKAHKAHQNWMKESARTTEKVTCEFCAKQFTKVYIEEHIKVAHGDHRIPCTEPGCDYIIRHPDAVRVHMRMSHQNATCAECGWSGAKRHLKRHMGMAHSTIDKRTFKCSLCPKSFMASHLLNDHMNVHTGEKPHKCPVCGQGFASKPTMLGHHKSVHLGIKRK